MDAMDQVQEEQTDLTEKGKVRQLRSRKKAETEQTEMFPVEAKIRQLRAKLPEIRKSIADDLKLVGEFQKFFKDFANWGTALDAFNELEPLRYSVKVGITKADEFLSKLHEINSDLQNFDDTKEELNRMEALKQNGYSDTQSETGGEVGEASESDDPDFREVEDVDAVLKDDEEIFETAENEE